MQKCKNCSVPIAFSAGLLVASLLPAKAVCVVAADLLIITCIARRRSSVGAVDKEAVMKVVVLDHPKILGFFLRKIYGIKKIKDTKE